MDNGALPDTRVIGWVISAGYGLIPVESKIKPYSATFTRNVPDSVCPTFSSWSESDWWQALMKWNGPDHSKADLLGIRSLKDLGLRTDNEPILLSASRIYLRAVEADLLGLIQSRDEAKGSVVVFGAEIPPSITGLRQNEGSDSYATVTYDSRLQSKLGGSRIGLNIRTLSYALRQSGDPSQAALAAPIKGLMNELEPVKPLDRARANNREVEAFIRGSLEDKSEEEIARVRPSPLLREWRSRNRACEQKRFRDLFWKVHKELTRGSENQVELDLLQEQSG